LAQANVSLGLPSQAIDPASHPQAQIPYRKKLNPFFFSGRAGWPLTALVICRIALEISESSSMSEVAVFCIRRTAT
jgi:hypothetical protein